MYAEIVQEPRFYFDEKGIYYPEATTFIMTGNNLLYLYKMLMTKTITYLFKKYYAGGGLGESGYRYKKAFIELLPIPKTVSELTKKICKTDNEEELENLVCQLYGFNELEIKHIENREV